MSHGKPLAAEGKFVTSGIHDSVESPRSLEIQENLRFLKPQPSYCVEGDDLGPDQTYPWFKGIPSRQEVEEATLDLKTSYTQRHLTNSGVVNDAPPSDTDCPGMSAMEPCYDVQVLHRGRDSSAQSSPSTGGSVVAQCVDLLQRDPDVQAAVISLATDPAIWNAFVKNDKVQELMRNKHIRLPEIPAARPTQTAATRINPILVALCCVKNAVWDMMDTLVDSVSSIFGLLDRKVFGERDSDPVDRPLKACLVLTILVLALVLLKRRSSSSSAAQHPGS